MINNPLKLTAATLFLVLATSACTSSLVLGTAYNAAAKRTAERFKTYVEFDDSQQQWIEQSFQSYHHWHRKFELPAYGNLLTDIVGELRSDQPVARAKLDQWFNQIETYGNRARSCSPLSGSIEFLSGMADWQIQQLDRKLKSNRLEHIEKYQKETPEERSERRLKLIVKWSGRAGLKLTDSQQQLLASTLAKQTSMGEKRFQLWEKWTDEFTTLLMARNTEEFPVRAKTHIDSLWTLTEKHYPTQWQQSQDLWMGFGYTLLNDLSSEQKNALSETIQSVAESTRTLSKKASRATPICYAG